MHGVAHSVESTVGEVHMGTHPTGVSCSPGIRKTGITGALIGTCLQNERVKKEVCESRQEVSRYLESGLKSFRGTFSAVQQSSCPLIGPSRELKKCDNPPSSHQRSISCLHIRFGSSPALPCCSIGVMISVICSEMRLVSALRDPGNN